MSIRSFFSGLRESFKTKSTPKEARVSNDVSTFSMAIGGRTKKPDANLRTLADEGYRRNVVLHAAVNIIANTVSEPEVYAIDSNTDKPLVDTHPLNELLWMPDRGNCSKNQLLRAVVISLKTLGNAFIHKGRNAKGVVVRLRHVRADRIEIVPDRVTGEVEAYEYKITGVEKPQRIEKKDMIHIKFFDPLDDYYGLSPMTVAAKFADLDSEAALYMRDFFINGAMPAGLLKVRAKTNKSEREDAREQWKETYGKGTRGRDVSNWWNIGVIDQDVEYQALGQGPAEMRLDGIWNITESRLCAAVGVPPILVQTKLGLERGTYSNYEQARRQFWEETLIPLYGLIADTLTSELATEFDEEAEIVFDTSKVGALQESADAKNSRIVAQYGGGVISRDEAREDLGHEKGDVDVILLDPKAIDASLLKDKLTPKEPVAPAAGVGPDGKTLPAEAPPAAPGQPEPKPPEPVKPDGDPAELPPAAGKREATGADLVQFERFLRQRRRERLAKAV